MKKMLLLLVLFFVQVLWGQTATQPSFGNGTSGSPYQISSLEHLYWIASNSERWSLYYIQMAGIDVSATSGWFSDGSGGYYGWTPIGNSTTAFTGSYDGQGQEILGLYINRASSDYIGFFGNLSGTISNLGLTNTNISGKDFVGGLVGENSMTCTIQNCYTTGVVTGGNYVGGLVGWNTNSSTIKKSYSTVTISGSAGVGGLVGWSNNSTIENSYSTGNVTRKTGSSDSKIGAFIGWNLSTIQYCYSIGNVSYTGDTNPADKGFVGNNSGTCTNNFWDDEVSNQSTGTGATAKTTAEMKTNSTFTNAGWDIAIWNMGDGINNGYPYLDWQNASGTPLPVELTSFSASIVNGKVVLIWSTDTEVNNYGFEIFRFASNDKWEKIGFVRGHGNSNSIKDYTFTDNTPPNGKIKYRLKQIDFNGVLEYSNEIEIDIPLPTNFSLHQNYPNPFNPETTISFKVQAASNVTLKVYDVLGREIETLVNEFKQPGVYNSTFYTLRSSLPSGIYFYRLQAGSYISTKKMTLVK